MRRKNNLVLTFGLLGLLSLGASAVIGQTTAELPRVTTACETKIGGLLFGVDDGFSTLKFCPRNSRKVVLGEKGTSVSMGEVAFMWAEGGVKVLKSDGTVWNYNEGELPVWREDTEMSSTISKDLFDKIAQWTGRSFITNEGRVYLFEEGSWIDKGIPGLN